MASLKLRRLTGAIGAEISGVDLREPVDADTFAQLRDACLQYYVLVFRRQFLEPAAQVAFTARWGEPVVIPYLKTLQVPDFPPVIAVPNMGKTKTVTEQWHSESSFLAAPPAYTVLAAKQLPEFGGDTMFANQYLAYETLSPTLQRVLEGLRAMHRGAKPNTVPGGDTAVPPPQSHPVIRTHPETGRKTLYVNPAYTYCFDGMTEPESQGLLAFLLEHVSRPDFVYRHQWTPGDVLVWDNRCTIHYAVHDYGDAPRVVHRTITSDVVA